MTIEEGETQTPWWDSLFRLKHPSFPEHLELDASFSNTVLVKGKSTWKVSQGNCDLPSFDQDFCVPIASDRPVILDISDRQKSASVLSSRFPEDSNHVAILVLAWAYILSARWAEILPDVSGPEYSKLQAERDLRSSCCENIFGDPDSLIVDIGDVDDDAARWWAAVLCQEGGWNVSVSSAKGHILYSPWHTKPVLQYPFQLSRSIKYQQLPTQLPAAPSAAALQYLSSYCKLHNIFEQMHAALAAALLLPVCRYDNRSIQLPIPRLQRKGQTARDQIFKTPSWMENLDQLDKLLTLSCNAVGTKALLNSIFFEPGVECNICGAWLQGTFAFLDSDIIQDQNSLLRILMKRDPSLEFLWLGAFITGAHTRALQEARLGWWKIDLNVAAWTGTLMSFIQEPVSTSIPETHPISRADECRLLYLSHDLSYTGPPVFPFAPFGSTALADANIDVRMHAECGINHSLEYESLTWRCRPPQVAPAPLFIPTLRAKIGSPTASTLPINYDSLDNEDDDCSEMVTRNIFTWLRDEDGFPVAERAIREHEWIDNLDSDDDEPITGETRSTVGGNLHGWLLKTSTRRSNSI